MYCNMIGRVPALPDAEGTVVAWPEEKKLEGRAEIYLQWKNLAMITFVMSCPLLIALFFESWIVKIICYIVSLSAYVSYLRVQGPCVMAAAVSIISWYVYFEWNWVPGWSIVIPIVISLVEFSYARHRMSFIEAERSKEGVIL